MGPELWKKVEDEIKELVRVLEGEGVKVVQPKAIDYSQKISTPNFSTTGMFGWLFQCLVVLCRFVCGNASGFLVGGWGRNDRVDNGMEM